MKLIRSRMAALAFVASVGPAAAGSMDSAVRNCTWCHGTSAQGLTIAPRLAGQRSQYIANQLVNFRSHARDNPFSKDFMWSAAANVGPREARDLAIYFSTLPPRSADDGERELMVTGRTIYEEGIPEANIVSCAVCHGPNAEGVRQIPRLGGLSYSYLRRKLKQWGEGYHASAEPPMPRIASNLPQHVVEALASYLSFVK